MDPEILLPFPQQKFDRVYKFMCVGVYRCVWRGGVFEFVSTYESKSVRPLPLTSSYLFVFNRLLFFLWRFFLLVIISVCLILFLPFYLFLFVTVPFPLSAFQCFFVYTSVCISVCLFVSQSVCLFSLFLFVSLIILTFTKHTLDCPITSNCQFLSFFFLHLGGRKVNLKKLEWNSKNSA